MASEIDFPRATFDDQEKKEQKRKDNEESTSKGDAVPKRLKNETRLIPKKIDAVWLERLNEKVLVEGVLVLGCVRTVSDVDVTLELPDGLSGVVSALDISDEFSKRLRASEDADILPPLSAMFSCGQLICALVKSWEKNKYNKSVCKLTMNPRETNQGLFAAALQKGIIIPASVKSVEDNGYLMDVGLPSVPAFLPFKSVRKFMLMLQQEKSSSESQFLHIGQTLLCCIHKSNVERLDHGAAPTLILSVDPAVVAGTTVPDTLRTENLLPGMLVNMRVEKTARTGLFMKRVAPVDVEPSGGPDLWRRGFVSCRRLPKSPVEDCSRYSEGQELKAVVLYVRPHTKMLGLSLQQHLTNVVAAPLRREPEQTLPVGCVCVAVSRDVTTKNGVYFSMKPPTEDAADATQRTTFYAYGPAVKLHGKEGVVQTKYASGTKHQCRIVGFSQLERLFYVSTKKSVLRQPVVDVASAVVGTHVKAIVKSITQAGIFVRLYNHINGFIPAIHLSDVPVKNSLRLSALMKKYEVGAQLKCRILSIDLEHQRLVLTCKPSFVDADDRCPIVSQFSPEFVGASVDGTVVQVNPNGLLVTFYGNVKGWLPVRVLHSVGVHNPLETYKVGQVLRVCIFSIDAENQKMQLGLQASGLISSKEAALQQAVDTKSEPDNDYEDNARNYLHETFAVVVTRRTPQGIYVEILPSRRMGFIPAFHLSDSLGNWEALATTFKPGDKISACCYFQKDASICTVSAKPSLVEFARKGFSLQKFEELGIGMLLAGLVARVHDQFGYFLEFPGGLCGLCPYSSLDQKEVPYIIGQTVIGRVQHVDFERRRFSVSLKLQNCLTPFQLSASFDLLRRYLSERERITIAQSKLGKELCELLVGESVSVRVEKVSDAGLCCCLCDQPSIKGVIVKENMMLEGDQKQNMCKIIGRKLEATIVYQDLQENCLELAVFDAKETIASKKNKNLSDFVGQTLEARVLLVKPDFVLVNLVEIGFLAYLPSRLHPNDQGERQRFAIGGCLKVVVTELFGNRTLLASSEANEAQMKNTKNEEQNFKNTENFTLPPQLKKTNVSVAAGGSYSAVVKSVGPLCLRILIEGKREGTIHVSELQDEYKDGTFPVQAFSERQLLPKVKVIRVKHSVWDVEAKKALSKIAECTLKHSKVFSKSNKKAVLGYRTKFVAGQTVPVFVKALSGDKCELVVNPLWKGRIDLLDVTDDLNVLHSLQNYLKPGQALNATILKVDQKHNVLELTCLKRQKSIPENSFCICRVVSKAADSGVFVRLPSGFKGVARPTDLCDNFEEVSEFLQNTLKINQFVKCQILRRNGHKDYCVSLRNSCVSGSNVINVKDPPVDQPEELNVGAVYRGFVKSSSAAGIQLWLGSNAIGLVSLSHLTEYFIKSPENALPKGALVCARVLEVFDDAAKAAAGARVKLSMLPCDIGLPDQLPVTLRKRKRRPSETSDAQPETKLRRQRSISLNSNLSVADGELSADGKTLDVESQSLEPSSIVETKPVVVKHEPGTSAVEGIRLSDFNWNSSGRFSMMNLMSVGLNLDTLRKADTGSKKTTKGIKVEESEEEDQSSTSEFDAEDFLGTVKTEPGTSAESESGRKKHKRLKRELKEEAAIREKELALLAPEEHLESAEDFDRLLMSSPNSSKLWLKYMAFFLQTADVDKVRAVSERALKMISFRSEQDRLNIWAARMNLENTYGTAQSLQEVVANALQTNDQLKIYKHLISMYQKSKKLEEGDETIQTMLKKFKQNFDVWLDACTYYMTTVRPEIARQTLQNALRCLPSSEHVNFTSRFAQLEFRAGDKEKGKTLFESIVCNYPKRLDIWFVYADMLTKHDTVFSARSIYERMASLRLQAARMKSIFKKWVQFEEAHGTTDTVQVVREKAFAYVQSALS